MVEEADESQPDQIRSDFEQKMPRAEAHAASMITPAGLTVCLRARYGYGATGE